MANRDRLLDDNPEDDNHNWSSGVMKPHEGPREKVTGHRVEKDDNGAVLDEDGRKPPPVAIRQLDLDDFANSPAADADDTAEEDTGDDIEMKLALG